MQRGEESPSRGTGGRRVADSPPTDHPFPPVVAFPPVLVLLALLLLGMLGGGMAPSGVAASQASPDSVPLPASMDTAADVAGPGDTTAAMDPAGNATPDLQAAVERRAPVRELLAIYRRMDGIRDVRIHLEDGILELSGTALSTEARAAAGEVAEGLPGIVWVDNRLTVETDLRKRLAPALERLEEKGVAFLRFLPSLLVGLLIVGASIALATWVGNRSFPFERVAPNAFSRNLLRQAVRAGIVLLGVVLALDLLAATALVGAVLGAAGLLGIAVGFAFRDIVENYLAGVLLSLRQPFSPNDHLELAGFEGRVVRLTGRETILMTLDGNHVRIPNATVYKEVTTNFSRNPRRRFLVTVSVAPWEDLSNALSLARSAVAGVTGVLPEPRVSGRIHQLGDSAIDLRVFGWVDQTVADFGKVRSEALRAVKETFESEGVATPPPEYGIRILDDGEKPGRTDEPGHREQKGEDRTPPSERPHRPVPVGATEASTDVSPDTTIEEEIARELATSQEENLLRPGPEAKAASGPGAPPPPPGG
jgi:small conductance mechanosensitive channel